jgi:hypothetical protein
LGSTGIGEVLDGESMVANRLPVLGLEVGVSGVTATLFLSTPTGVGMMTRRSTLGVGATTGPGIRRGIISIGPTGSGVDGISRSGPLFDASLPVATTKRVDSTSFDEATAK